MKKKKLIAMSLAVILAVALAAGGTLAYLSGTSKTATNNVANDFNWVSLTETVTPGTITTDGNRNITNTGYEIIPGTSQDKNPTVNVSYSLDSYVYVTVEDTSGGLITWAAASGWTLLTGTDEYDASGNLAGVLLLTPVGEAIAYITSSTANVVNTFIGETTTCDETKDTTSEPDVSSDEPTTPDETKDTTSEPDVSSDEPTTPDETKDTSSEPDVSSDEPTTPDETKDTTSEPDVSSDETTGVPSEPDDSSDDNTGPYEEAPQTGVEDPLEIFLYILVMTVSVAVFCTMQYCIKHSRDSEKGRREK